MPKALLIIFKTYWVLFPPWSSYRDFFHIQNVFLSFSGVHYLSSWTVNVPDSRQENSTKSWLIVCTGISTLIMHSFSSWKTLKYATGFVTFNNPKAAYILSLSLYSYYFYLSCSTTWHFFHTTPQKVAQKRTSISFWGTTMKVHLGEKFHYCDNHYKKYPLPFIESQYFWILSFYAKNATQWNLE